MACGYARDHPDLRTMHRTVSLALVLIFTISLAACGGGSKATPTSTPPAATATSVSATSAVAGPIPTVEGVATVTASSLQIIDTIVGTGAEAKVGDTITAQYTGYLEDGTIFDGPTLHGGPIQFSLSGVIQGWTDGVPGMKVGGKRRLVIPPALAYGAAGRSGIPPNATLTFDIELVSIP
jgi:FKBP-type peptidyl-prolyl cis-trans isomerase